MPKDLGVVGLLYNKDLFAKAGVTMPAELTWAPDGSGSFHGVARKLTKSASKQWGFCSWNHSQTQWLNWIASNGGQAMDKPYGNFDVRRRRSRSRPCSGRAT